MVSKHLKRVAGVADVVSFGGFQKEYHVLADPARLRANGLTLKDLIDAVSPVERRHLGRLRAATARASSSCAARGYLKSAGGHREDRHRARRTARPSSCATSPRVVEGYTPRRGAVARGDAIDSVEGTILLRRGENPKDVLDGIHEAVERVNQRRAARRG